MLRYSFLFLSTVLTLAAQVGPPLTVQVISGNNQSAVVGTGFAQQLTIRVVDQFGAGVSGLTVTYTLPTPASGLATGIFEASGTNTVTVTTNALGFATSSPFAANSWAGGYNAMVTIVPTGGGRALSSSFIEFNGGIAAPDVFPSSLTFSMVIGDRSPPLQTVTVSSATDGFDATSDSPWLKVVVRTNVFLDVSVDPTGLAAGRYFGNVTVSKKTVVPVQFTINPKPMLTATVSRINFAYVQGDGQSPLGQFFSVGSSMRNIDFQVSVKYNNPTTGNWLFGASMRGLTTPIQLQAVCDPRGMGPGTYQAEIDITSPDATNSPLVIPVTMVVAKYPYAAPEVTSVFNAASTEVGAISAGELVRVSGSNLACSDGASVLLDGEAAAVVSTGGSEIGIVVPNNLTQKTRVQVRVGCGKVLSDPFSVPLSYAAPGLFMVDRTRALAFNADRTLNSRTSPAGRGSVVTLYGTGFGDGAIGPIAVNIGGQAATLLSVSPVDEIPGAMRLLVRVPYNAATGDARVEVLAGAETAQSGSTIVIQ